MSMFIKEQILSQQCKGFRIPGGQLYIHEDLTSVCYWAGFRHLSSQSSEDLKSTVIIVTDII